MSEHEIAGKPVHPAAQLFPMMDAERYGSLRDSIRENGLRHPVVLYEGAVLDGRNRLRACDEIGIEPETVEHDGDPWTYAWDCNGQRRDLTAEQRYVIWKRATEGSDAWQAEQERRRQEANRARSEAAKGRPRNDDGTLASAPAELVRCGHCLGEYVDLEELGDHCPMCDGYNGDVETSAATTCGTTGSAPPPDRTSAAKAAASGTNRGAVERMDQLDRERPDLVEKVRAGEMKPSHALREMKRAQVQGKVEALPDGKFRVLYADPPWKYGDERNFAGYDQSAAAGQYPTMSVDELKALDVRSLAAEDAVLFCWATFPLLPDALEVVKGWGFKYKTAVVWWKKKGNLGNYHNASAELLIIATRGSCTPESTERPDQVQVHVRKGRHSEKPEHFRDLIDSMYPSGPRLELFRRGDAPRGWKVWGNEAG